MVSEESEWEERRQQTGVAGRIVIYEKNENPRDWDVSVASRAFVSRRVLLCGVLLWHNDEACIVSVLSCLHTYFAATEVPDSSELEGMNGVF